MVRTESKPIVWNDYIQRKNCHEELDEKNPAVVLEKEMRLRVKKNMYMRVLAN